MRSVSLAMAVASLLLCVATVALWVRSRSADEGVIHVALDSAAGRLTTRFIAFTGGGEVCAFQERITITGGPPGAIAAAATGPESPGLHYDRTANGGSTTMNFDGVAAAPRLTVHHAGRFRVGHASTQQSFLGTAMTEDDRFATVPTWFVATSFAAWPAVTVVRWWRTRGGIGRCRRCGYDLRATPDRCPECGAVGVAERPI